jgi:hypothetical protein
MEHVFYIYDPDYEKLVVMQCQIGMVTDEDQIKYYAREEGMNWEKCLWGQIRHLSMGLDDDR